MTPCHYETARRDAARLIQRLDESRAQRQACQRLCREQSLSYLPDMVDPFDMELACSGAARSLATRLLDAAALVAALDGFPADLSAELQGVIRVYEDAARADDAREQVLALLPLIDGLQGLGARLAARLPGRFAATPPESLALARTRVLGGRR